MKIPLPAIAAWLALALLLGAATRASAEDAPAAVVPVRHIALSGNTVFSEAKLHALVQDFEGRPLSDEQLEDLRQRLTRWYVAAGYVDSGAVIEQRPDADGLLRVRIVEGRLTAVRISGPHHYRDSYLQHLIAPQPQSPLNLNELQRNIQLLLQDGTLAQINAQLQPGLAPGEAVLDAKVREGPRFRADFSADDSRPTSVGETGGTVALSARDLLGGGDAGSFNFGRSSGYTNYGLQESVPLWAPLLSAFVKADSNRGNIVESSLQELGVTSLEKSFELGYTDTLVRSLRDSVTLAPSFYYTDTSTYLLGMPFSFTPGVDDGHSRVAAVRLALDWTSRGTQQVIAVHSALAQGLHAFGSTAHGDGLPDSRFLAWSAQMQYVQQLWSNGQLVAKGALQLASKSLLPSEKTSIGGVDTVRGYAANTLVRDEGGFVSAEYRHTVAHLQVPGLSRTPADGALALAAFYDAGTAKDRIAGSAQTWIAGTGVGLRWSPAANCDVQFYKGFPLHHLPSDSNGLQDRGLYFRVAYGLAF